MLKRKGIFTGLGDRIGNYLIFATLGEILNTDIYTTWIYDSERGNQYPENIEEYISFPKKLKFISNKDFELLNIPLLEYRWVYHGFDYIPETIYKSLKEDKNINCSFDEMIKIYRNVCKELYYKKELPIELFSRPGVIHLRRGINVNHNDRILKLVNKFETKVNNWIITSDSDIPEIIITSIPNIINPNWSDNYKIKTLEEFFLFTHASIIIQSVNLENDSHWSGWAGFSYVGFQIGLSIYNNPEPILISCNKDDENTRLTYAKKYAKRDLKNIFSTRY